MDGKNKYKNFYDKTGIGLWIILLIYLFVVLMIGVFSYFKNKRIAKKPNTNTVSAHFLAGSKMGGIVLTMTVFSATFQPVPFPLELVVACKFL